MPEELRGEIERITFCNPENNFTIARLKTNRGTYAIKGIMVRLDEGETIEVKGNWKTHPVYGEQFEVQQYQIIEPSSTDGILKYLSSGIIKGIGKATAKKIVDHFGKDTFSLLDTDIDNIFDVKTVPAKKLEAIKVSWQEQREMRSHVAFLQGLGISSNAALKIFTVYGNNTTKFVQENPYKLIDDIDGIGFLTADTMAGNLGFASDSNERVAAALLYYLKQHSEEGHVYFPYDQLVTECMQQIRVDTEVVSFVLNDMQKKKRVYLEKITPTGGEPEYTAVFSASLYTAEKGIARFLKESLNTPRKPVASGSRLLEWIRGEIDLEFADEQLEAIKAAIENKVIVITGGPGTGKTTLINSIFRLFTKIKQRVMLAAPTGRAAKKMTESTGSEAKTIHRLLEYNPTANCFDINEENQLEADLIIIDEISMVDTYLFYHLLKAIPQSANLILVGDVNQLPSIGPGNILKDIIDSQKVPAIILRQIYRQAASSSIIVNAHKINNGLVPEYVKDEESDFWFLQIPSPHLAAEKAIELCTSVIPKKLGISPRDIQVLSPMHKGTCGVETLNKSLQQIINPSKDEVFFGEKLIKLNDKVMQIKNNYQKEVFNGDIGLIKFIDRDKKKISIDFDGKLVRYDFSEIDEIIPAYAISIHKSQGSEYPAVILLLQREHYRMLQRNLLYTGITRGKQLVVLIAAADSVRIAVGNDKAVRRYTCLKERLAELLPDD